MPSDAKTTQFEDLLRQFDDAVSSLENESMTLEQTLDTYQSAVSLALECADILKSAELRIVEIDKNLEEIEADIRG